MVMSGVGDIPGAPSGIYRDGGVLDYHINVPFSVGDEDLVLFPHYTNRIIPGWFDKKITWRKPNSAYLDNVVMIAPSPEFVASLPYGKIPYRNDFVTMHGQEEARFKYWHAVADKSQVLADAFHDALATGKIAEMVRPLQ